MVSITPHGIQRQLTAAASCTMTETWYTTHNVTCSFLPSCTYFTAAAVALEPRAYVPVSRQLPAA